MCRAGKQHGFSLFLLKATVWMHWPPKWIEVEVERTLSSRWLSRWVSLKWQLTAACWEWGCLAWKMRQTQGVSSLIHTCTSCKTHLPLAWIVIHIVFFNKTFLEEEKKSLPLIRNQLLCIPYVKENVLYFIRCRTQISNFPISTKKWS